MKDGPLGVNAQEPAGLTPLAHRGAIPAVAKTTHRDRLRPGMPVTGQ